MEKLLGYEVGGKRITLFKTESGFVVVLDSGARLFFMTLESALKTFDTLINE